MLVSQFHFVYWYNIVLEALTRSASSVDVECIISITGQILNGKLSSLSECTVGRQTVVYTQQLFLVHKYGRYE